MLLSLVAANQASTRISEEDLVTDTQAAAGLESRVQREPLLHASLPERRLFATSKSRAASQAVTENGVSKQT